MAAGTRAPFVRNAIQPRSLNLKKSSSLLLSLTAVVFASASSARAQENTAPTFTRPRTVSTAQQSPSAATTPAPNTVQTPASPQRTPPQQPPTGAQPSTPASSQQPNAPASPHGT